MGLKTLFVVDMCIIALLHLKGYNVVIICLRTKGFTYGSFMGHMVAELVEAFWHTH